MSPSLAPDGWTIDELARHADVSVGTIRLYQSEGLLPPGRRLGRSMRFGLAHLDRLRRIQQLRDCSFTLAAVRRMLDEGLFVLLDRVLGADERPRVRAQLAEESGVDERLVDLLEHLGFLAAPGDRGAETYDGADVRVLEAVGQLEELGTPPAMLKVVLPIYMRHMGALQEELLCTLSGRTDLGPDLSGDAVAAYNARAAEHTDAFLNRWDVIVDYLHHRMIQRLVHLARSRGEPVR
ncbi:MAG TPA: MerR family transcriptional regulator [Acidimicrobiales bacterium]